jgi:hypothetical protein
MRKFVLRSALRPNQISFSHSLGRNRPTYSALACLLSSRADMAREKAPLLGRTFRLDTSAGFGKRASMRF